MNTHLKILMLEDSPVDAEIIGQLLKKNIPSYEVLHAMDQPSFVAALEQFEPDVILADNALPQYSATEALKLVRDRSLQLPFILVTGSVSEEFAAGIIKLGADDYILKDRLARLPAAIQSALKQRAAEKAKQAAQQLLVESEVKYRSMFENSPLPMYLYNKETLQFLDVNQKALQHYGYEREEFLAMTVSEIRPPEDVTKFKNAVAQLNEGYQDMGLWRHSRKSGEVIQVRIFSHDIIYNNIPARMIVVEDVTERIRSEALQLEMEKKLADQKIQEQKKISRAIIQAQEAERNHIGKELHDNVNQILVGTKLYLGMIGKKDESLSQAIKYPLELIDSSINEIRQLSSRHVTPLRDIDLRELIESLLEGIEKTAGLQTRFSWQVQANWGEDDLKLNIYRIIQEQVNNVVKHANARSLEVLIKANEHAIHIKVLDDGKGFDPQVKRNGIGIANMLNRIETFNGRMCMDTAPGKGCETHISIPHPGLTNGQPCEIFSTP